MCSLRAIRVLSWRPVTPARHSRPAQALITDASQGGFQIVLAEAMDRLSRDQEDIAGLFKRMALGSVKIMTLSEGEVSQLHVGLRRGRGLVGRVPRTERCHASAVIDIWAEQI